MTLLSLGVWLVPRLARGSRPLRRLRSHGAIERIVSWVQAEQPDVWRATGPTGTVTLLFSDIEGSSRLMERPGEAEFKGLAGSHELLRVAWSAHRSDVPTRPVGGSPAGG